eukprot:3754500-Heterocapsa_arctica.AAC.1
MNLANIQAEGVVENSDGPQKVATKFSLEITPTFYKGTNRDCISFTSTSVAAERMETLHNTSPFNSFSSLVKARLA